ncbi:MFS general substrate transporter [Atractiella rhizophila]|nr:MFS general substrate transporter [Atractiella rhizophila]
MATKHFPLALSLSSIVLNSITAGSIFTFPLWQPYLSALFGLSQSQTNTVALSAVVGQYVTAAWWGDVVDRKGPAVVSALGGLTFFIGYGLMSLLCISPPSSSGLSTVLLVLFYFLVGSATSCSYFPAIITLANSLPPSHAGLAVGIPCAIFGLSPVLLSNIAVAFFTGAGGEVNGQRWLAFLSVLLGVVNGLGGVLLKIIKVGDHSAVEEEEVGAADSGFGEGGEAEPLLRKKKVAIREKTLLQFLATPSTLILGAIVLLAAGPGEMIMSTLGSIIASMLYSTPAHPHPSLTKLSSKHVQLLSVANTCTRLVAGGLSDHLSTRIPRPLWLALGTLILCISYAFSSIFLTSPIHLYVISIGTGVGYGTIFTLVPSIIRTVYSPTQFGRNWGLTANFSAVGAAIFMELYGVWADAIARRENMSVCVGKECFAGTLAVSAATCAIAVILALVLWRKLSRKG